MERLPDMLVEGLLTMQARGRPNLYLLETVAEQAKVALAIIVAESRMRERRRRWAR